MYSKKERFALFYHKIIIPDDRPFKTGVDCRGKKPLGMSPECIRICTGEMGLKSVYPDIKLPCGFQVLKHQDFKKRLQEGIAGI